MTTATRMRRVDRLARRSSNWRAWDNVPPDQWPDEALIGRVAEGYGIPFTTVAALSDEDLERLIAVVQTAKEQNNA